MKKSRPSSISGRRPIEPPVASDLGSQGLVPIGRRGARPKAWRGLATNRIPARSWGTRINSKSGGFSGDESRSVVRANGVDDDRDCVDFFGNRSRSTQDGLQGYADPPGDEVA